MTLHRLLIGGLTATLLLLTLLLTFINFAASKRHLTEQQITELNNTSYSLSFALKPVIEEQSQHQIESVVHAMFDANFYDSLTIDFNDQRQDIHLQWDSTNHYVPTWFTAWLNLPNIEKTVDISSGWDIKATLTLRTSPVFTYIKLWNTTVAYLTIGSLFNLIAIGIFSLYLRKVLAPLRRLTTHMRHFPTNRTFHPETNNNTREIRTLVRSYNVMARQISSLLSHLESKTANLYNTAYIDPLTGLYNRQYVLDTVSQQFEHYHNLPDDDLLGNDLLGKDNQGHLLVFHITELEELKAQSQFAELNRRAKQVADTLNNATHESFTLSRLNDSEFALLSTKDDEALVMQTHQSLQHLLNDELNPTPHRCALLALKKFQNTRDLLIELNKTLI